LHSFLEHELEVNGAPVARHVTVKQSDADANNAPVERHVIVRRRDAERPFNMKIIMNVN
jgi:hypothetical protein